LQDILCRTLEKGKGFEQKKKGLSSGARRTVRPFGGFGGKLAEGGEEETSTNYESLWKSRKKGGGSSKGGKKRGDLDGWGLNRGGEPFPLEKREKSPPAAFAKTTAGTARIDTGRNYLFLGPKVSNKGKKEKDHFDWQHLKGKDDVSQ